MAGEALARGVPLPSGTDLARNTPAYITAAADKLARLIPFHGLKSAITNSDGCITVTHGLGFTPSAVLVQSAQSNDVANHSDNVIVCTGVDLISGVSFRCRFYRHGVAGDTFLLADGIDVAFYWLAFRD